MLEQSIFVKDGKFFRAGIVSEAKDSMIEAVDTVMRGGITIHDVTYILPSHGITLGECFDQNAIATMSFLVCRMKLIRDHQTPRASHQTRDDLIEIIDKQVDQNYPGHILLIEILQRMVKLCEKRMEEADIPLSESYYKK